MVEATLLLSFPCCWETEHETHCWSSNAATRIKLLIYFSQHLLHTPGYHLIPMQVQIHVCAFQPYVCVCVCAASVDLLPTPPGQLGGGAGQKGLVKAASSSCNPKGYSLLTDTCSELKEHVSKICSCYMWLTHCMQSDLANARTACDVSVSQKPLFLWRQKRSTTVIQLSFVNIIIKNKVNKC